VPASTIALRLHSLAQLTRLEVECLRVVLPSSRLRLLALPAAVLLGCYRPPSPPQRAPTSEGTSVQATAKPAQVATPPLAPRWSQWYFGSPYETTAECAAWLGDTGFAIGVIPTRPLSVQEQGLLVKCALDAVGQRRPEQALVLLELYERGPHERRFRVDSVYIDYARIQAYSLQRDTSRVAELGRVFLARYPSSHLSMDVRSMMHTDTTAQKEPSMPAEFRADHFDPERTSAQLNAVDIRLCASKEGPSGMGVVAMTLDPDGAVSAVKTYPPFEDTPRGKCIQDLFEATHFAPFSGNAIRAEGPFGTPEPLIEQVTPTGAPP
jgi:hypothetical protein